MTSNLRVVEGHLSAAGRRFAVITGRFNSFITDRLVEGAIDTIIRHGGDREAITLWKAPGAFELPMLAKRAVETGKYDAVVVCGCLIRGSTPHFDYIAAEATKGIAQASMASGVPISFGLLTCNTIEQAIERAGTKAGNKGGEAAMAAIEMADLYARLEA